MNDDTVVGTLWADDPYRHTETVYLSDLDEPYRSALATGTPFRRVKDFQRIAELEARLGKAILDCNHKGERIAELEASRDSLIEMHDRKVDFLLDKIVEARRQAWEAMK